MSKQKNEINDTSGMHYVNHNFGEWEIDTCHMSPIQKVIYLQMRTEYLKKGKSLTSDVELLAHRLACHSDEEKQALGLILRDKFELDKRTKCYKHRGWETVLKNYRARNWRNSINDTISSDDVTTDNSSSIPNTPLSDAQRKAKSRDAERTMRQQLLAVGVDSEGAKGMTELRKLFDTHQNKINSNYSNVATCHSESHAIVTQKEAITRKQKPENKNQKPFEREGHSQAPSDEKLFIQTDLIESNNSNYDQSLHIDFGIEEWQAPVKNVMQDALSPIGVILDMTDNEYDLHIEDFKTYYAEKAKIDKPLGSEKICKLRLRQWLQRAVESRSTKNSNKKQSDKRFNIDDEDWEDTSSDGKEVVNDIYHPSHKVSSTPEAKSDPKINVILNGLWRSPLPNMSVDETYTYIGQHLMPGESQDETYDRLIIEIQEGK
ncbi:DUF1376 domain-containing protein [Psychrobacter alimentarius]|uniref:DUF1376 domain-containing protein n=1 Tax=Psychrobacter alimentarius TaxID=261164 RepID=UPI00191AB605|nr:DUF1376 domain-containing protein [Psychrobacter alimentarius]